MVGVPMLKAERISRSGPKLSDAQTRNFEAIKYNRLVRAALIESAWHYSMCTPRPKATAPGADVPAAIRSRADECTARLCRRREALSAAGKNACKANAAVARELACWVWEIGCRAEGTLG